MGRRALAFGDYRGILGDSDDRRATIFSLHGGLFLLGTGYFWMASREGWLDEGKAATTGSRRCHRSRGRHLCIHFRGCSGKPLALISSGRFLQKQAGSEDTRGASPMRGNLALRTGRVISGIPSNSESPSGSPVSSSPPSSSPAEQCDETVRPRRATGRTHNPECAMELSLYPR